MRALFTVIAVAIVLPTVFGCGGAEKTGDGTQIPRGPTIHRVGREAAFEWKEAATTRGAFWVARRVGVLRTLEVLEDDTARMSLTFSEVEVEMNGRAVALDGEPAELRFMSGRVGGVSGTMSIIGESQADEPFVASVLPVAWPPVFEWPEPTEAGATVSITLRGDESPLEYRRRPGAPAGVTWIAIAGDLPVLRSPTTGTRARVSGLVARVHELDSRARLALSTTDDAQRGIEIEMKIGDGLPLPEPEPGGLLSCVPEVRELRSRLDEVPIPPFVLNRPIEDAMLTEGASEAVGPGHLMDLRARGDETPLDDLFTGLDADLPARDRAALLGRLREELAAIERTTELVQRLTGANPTPDDAPVYLLLDASAPARRARAIATAFAEDGREVRVVVRRPTTGPREGMLRGSLWPIAERLVERAADCPFIARAVAELETRDVVASPGWVRAMVAGGIGTCGCDDVMAAELAREVLRWSDVSLQSWGWKPITDAATGDATVGAVFAGG